LSMSKEIGLHLAGAFTETVNVGSGDAVPAQFHLSFQSRVGPVQWLK
jgi:protoheme ferro-lyase